MNRIEEIWDRGNDRIAQDDSLNSETILKSISENSKGITSRMLKPVCFGVIMAALAFLMLIYNLFFYIANPSIVILIIICLIASALAISYLFRQIRVLRAMDTLDVPLHKILVYKIKYLNSRYNIALHLISLSIVLATFTINLSIERNDGIFELHKILILSVFYLAVYLVIFSLSKLTVKVYDKQLKNALVNLEENTLRTLDEEMSKHKRAERMILAIAAILILTGLAALLFLT